MRIINGLTGHFKHRQSQQQHKSKQSACSSFRLGYPRKSIIGFPTGDIYITIYEGADLVSAVRVFLLFCVRTVLEPPQSAVSFRFWRLPVIRVRIQNRRSKQDRSHGGFCEPAPHRYANAYCPYATKAWVWLYLLGEVHEPQIN